MMVGKKTKIVELYEWKKRPFLDKMLDDGESPNQVHKWIVDNGFDITIANVYAYAKRRRDAVMKGIPIEEAMRANPAKKKPAPKKPAPKPKRQTKAQQAPKNTGVTPKSLYKDERQKEFFSVNRLHADVELLDAVMQKGYETLEKMEAIAPKDFLKAIELKNKLTGGSHGGLTIYGVEEIRLRESARENAITTVLLEYIPEDKHEEVLIRMEEATREFYEGLGLGEEYAKLEEVEERIHG